MKEQNNKVEKCPIRERRGKGERRKIFLVRGGGLKLHPRVRGGRGGFKGKRIRFLMRRGEHNSGLLKQDLSKSINKNEERKST